MDELDIHSYNNLSFAPGIAELQRCKFAAGKDNQALLADRCIKYLVEAMHVLPATLLLLSSAPSAMKRQNPVVNGGKYFQ